MHEEFDSLHNVKLPLNKWGLLSIDDYNTKKNLFIKFINGQFIVIDSIALSKIHEECTFKWNTVLK